MLSIPKSYTYIHNFQKLFSVVKIVPGSFLASHQMHHMGSFLMKGPTWIIFFFIQQSFWDDEKISEEASFSSENSFKKRSSWIFIPLLKTAAILSSRPHWVDLATILLSKRCMKRYKQKDKSHPVMSFCYQNTVFTVVSIVRVFSFD